MLCGSRKLKELVLDYHEEKAAVKVLMKIFTKLRIGRKVNIYTSLPILMLLDKYLFSLYIQRNETGYNNQWQDYCECIF